MSIDPATVAGPGPPAGGPPVIGVRRADTRRKALWTYARSRPLLIVGTGITATALLLAVLGPVVAPVDPEKATGDILEPPSGAHLFGTDASGLDVFSRVISAPRVDVAVALVATAISAAVGSTVGLLITFFEGRLGNLAMRASDIVQAFPLFVLAMILVTTSGRSLVALVFVIAVLNTPIFIRLTRTQVLAIRSLTFVESARAVGNSGLGVAFRHVLPNSLEPSLIQASVTIGFAILLTAGLSFIGAGVAPPTPDWGSMIASGAQTLPTGEWWPSVFPGIAMSITVFGFAAVAEGLREYLARGVRAR